MLLCIDVGNTNTVLGLYDLPADGSAGKLRDSFRVQTEKDRTGDEYGLQLRALFDFSGVRLEQVHDVIISSVVPPMAFPLEQMCQRFFGKRPLFVGPGIKTGMPVLYDNPREVGADRIVNAVAAFEKYGGPCIVADYGTATTFDVVSTDGDYLGGAIAPGIEVSLEALTTRAARLIKVELIEPEHAIGKSTTEALQSGAVYGFAGEIEGIVHAIWEELGEHAQVIATGGLADLIARHTDVISAVDPFLTLRGIEIVMRRQQRA